MDFDLLSKGPEIEEDNPGFYVYNEAKNRFNNVVPTRSRVQLVPSDFAWDEDYINADEVKFLGLSQHYILTQAPIADTTTLAFWKMIWDRDVSVVCALTRLSKSSKDRYWPSLGCSTMFSNLKVACMNFTQYDKGLKVYKLRLTIGAHSRSLRLIYDKRWPDFGVPSRVGIGLDLIYHINRLADAAPIVIHCTAGVGRSGTLCLMLAAAANRSIPLQSLLLELRQQRRGAVSTRLQYEFAQSVREAL